jgi:hypothetical protein
MCSKSKLKERSVVADSYIIRQSLGRHFKLSAPSLLVYRSLEWAVLIDSTSDRPTLYVSFFSSRSLYGVQCHWTGGFPMNTSCVTHDVTHDMYHWDSTSS